MNKELINNLRLDSGISRLADEKTLVCLSKDGKVIDPIDGLAIFAELIVQECLGIMTTEQDNTTMLLSYPSQSGAIYDAKWKIRERFGIKNDTRT